MNALSAHGDVVGLGSYRYKYDAFGNLSSYNPGDTNVSAYAGSRSDGIKVNIQDKSGISNVKGGLFGWSPNSPGRITMYTGDSRSTGSYTADQFKIVSAHEFGHILGIADGYNNETYKYYDSIMCDQWGKYNGTGKASNLDIAKAINAYKTKKGKNGVDSKK